MSNDNRNNILINEEDIKAIEGSNPESTESVLSVEENEAFNEELEKEKKFGDKGLRTALESAASSASFGLSDQVLVASGAATPEELRERRIRNKEADVAGEIAGVVGPALLSGGTSLAAKGLASGVKGAAKAGLAAEKLTASALKKILKDTGKETLARKVLQKSIAKGAGSAVEGSLYGAGELISEEALGNANLNAENLIASAGAGAVLGGLAGGVLGSVEALVPVIKGGKVVNFKNKTFANTLDPELNAMQLAGLTPTQIAKKKQFNPILVEHTPKMLKEVADKKSLNAFSSNKQLLKSVNEFIEETGEGIGKTLNEVTDSVQHTSLMPTEYSLASKINKRLSDMASKFKDANGKPLATAGDSLAKIEKVIKQFDDSLISDKTISASELNNLKSKYQKLAKWDRRGNLPISEEINREISRAIKDEVIEVAEKAGNDLGAKLKKQMLDYGSAFEFADSLGSKIDKQSAQDFIGFKDALMSSLLIGTNAEVGSAALIGKKLFESDFKRRLVILSSIEKANQTVNTKISKGVSNFIKNKRVAKSAALKTLTSNGLAYDLSGDKPKKPKNKDEAFRNVTKNLTDMQDPDKAQTFLNRGNIQDAAPQTHIASQGVLSAAAMFLQDKLPTSFRSDGALNPLLKKDFKPSSLELAKFERYMTAIENPLSVVEDLQNGKVSRDSVEALKAVYPAMYEKIQMEVMTQIQNSPESIDYAKRLQLGVLLDIPTDAALVPSNIAGLQSHFKETEQSQSGGAISATQASKLDLAESQATEVQKTSNRTDLK